MIAIAQSLLNMNNDTRKDYTLKYERLLKETKASVSSTENASNVSVPLCPKCGAKLVIRTAQKGANVGKQFYGCSSFPKCKFTLNIITQLFTIKSICVKQWKNTDKFLNGNKNRNFLIVYNFGSSYFYCLFRSEYVILTL